MENEEETKKTKNSVCSTYLPQEVIFEILVRLPITMGSETLPRCKAVCKQWYSLITDPLFTRTQFHLYKKQFHIPSWCLLSAHVSSFVIDLNRNQFRYNITTKDFVDHPIPVSSSYFKLSYGRDVLLSLCHGILCLFLEDKNKLCLWNPTIDEVRFVSLPYDEYEINRFYYVGFGYAFSIDDYKIVFAVEYTAGHPGTSCKSVSVYSLRHNEWRELDFEYCNSIVTELELYLGLGFQTSTDHRNAMRVESTVLNDALHWILVPNIYNKNIKAFLYKFDLVNECFEKVVDLNSIDILIDDDDDDDKLTPIQTEIGVSENNRLMIYKLYYEEDISKTLAMKRDVVKAWEMVDQYDYKSWKTKFHYVGIWDGMSDDHDLVQITGNGNVVIIGGKFAENDEISLQVLQNNDLDFFAAHYVPSRVSPNKF